jgi:enoyl-CoA hydratase/carnithine racemase
MLMHLIGVSRTLEMALSGEMIDAAEALRIRLVSTVVPTADLMPSAHAIAQKLLAGAPLAQRAIKACVYRALFEPDGLDEFNTRVDMALTETEDHREGFIAFAEKRQPVWRGR